MSANKPGIRDAYAAMQDDVDRGDFHHALEVLREISDTEPDNPTLNGAIARLKAEVIARRNKRPELSRPLAAYAQNTMLTTLVELYHRLVLGSSKKTGLRWAVIGEGCGVWTLGEIASEWPGYQPTFFETKNGGMFVPGGARLDALQVESFDIVCIDVECADEEEQYLRRVNELMAAQKIRRPIFLARKVSRAYFDALSSQDELRTCLSPRKLAAFTLALAATGGAADRIFECGAYQCGTSAFAGCLLTSWKDNRNYDAIDTFAGMPSAHEKDGTTVYQAGTFFNTSFDEARAYLDRTPSTARVRIHQGLAQEVMERICGAGEKVSFALIDTDQYCGTAESLAYILPRLKKNGIVIIDDYGLCGVRRAIDEAKLAYPNLEGHELTGNFYLLWNDRDEDLFSCASSASAPV